MSRFPVYRIEHQLTGQGPFGADSSQELRDRMSDYCARAGGLVDEAPEDCPGFEAGYHYCAVQAVDKVNDWFGPFREELLAAGFVLMEYEPLPANVRSSDSGQQVVFAKYAATPRRQLPWPKLKEAPFQS